MGSTHIVSAVLGLPPLMACVLSCLHCSGFRLLYRERALSCMHFSGLNHSGSGSWVLHKGSDLVGPAFCALPDPSSLGNQVLDERTLFRCSATYPLPSPSLSFPVHPVRCALCLFWGADLWLRPSRRISTIQNFRKSLVRNWKPVCSFVGDALSGAKFAPFWLELAPAAPLPPVGHAPICSWLALLWKSSVLCSVNVLVVPWVRAFCRLILSLSLVIPQFRLP